ncbi:MAG: DUF1254 domain-containing protein [Chlorobium sp.]|nr:MAG: DUF1254 domain-containing protein [Chlorobium sp.]
MKPFAKSLSIVTACVLLMAVRTSSAEPENSLPPSITTPDKVETRIGTLNFKYGMPSQDTLDKVYENLDFTHAFETFVNTMQGVNTHGLHRGFLDAGVKDNELILFPELIDTKSLFLTANEDTVYVGGFLDLTHGPMVLEVPPKLLGAINDYWGRWVIDIGGPGPDRGLGGKYLILPPGYDGPLPEGGFFVAQARTRHLLLFSRMFMQNNDPKPASEDIRRSMKVYPYKAGGIGTSFAAFLHGDAHLSPITPPPETVFHNCSGKVMNTIAPNDFSYFEWLNEVVQMEPANSLDPELMGAIAAIGIVKGKPFAPDARMKKILNQAVEVANATSRSLFMNPRDPSWYYYPGSTWMPLTLFVSGYDFEAPPSIVLGPVHNGMRTPEGVTVIPSTGYRNLDTRTCFFYGVMCVSPAEAMRMTGIGSQYLTATRDSNKQYFEGAKTYKLTLPKGIPASMFWSLTLYDSQTRSMLETPQRYPRAGSQGFPTPASLPGTNGSTTVYFSPEQPAGVPRGNWIQTVPGKGWFVMLRLYGPLEPFFDKTWRPSEIEPVK